VTDDDLMDAMADAVERFVDCAMAPLRAELAILKAAAPVEPKPAEVDYERLGEIVKAIVGAALAASPLPTKGDPGKDAVVDYDRVGEIIALAVTKEFGKQAPPKPGDPGKDAVVDYALIREFVSAAAVNAVAALPKPEIPAPIPGKDADEAAIVRAVLAQIPVPVVEPGLQAPEVEAIVARAVAVIPAPVPGVSVDDIIRIVSGQVDAAVKALPPAVPGKDADMAVVRAEIERAFAGMPPPLNFDAVVAAVKSGIVEPTVDEDAIVQRVVARLPEPKAGRDFDPDLMRAEIGRLFAEMPKPEGVHQDTVALMVRDAVAEEVKSIRSPEDGEPGRDAADLPILPTLERGRSYARGTFALHDGGTVVAFRETDPLDGAESLDAAGWRVAQDGIKAIASEEVDERTHRLIVTRTSDKVERLDFVTSFANMDKGVYRPGMKYLAGSGVTHDQSYWIAKRDTDTSPPGDDWRLILKGKFRP
jgi:hypothetical protein